MFSIVMAASMVSAPESQGFFFKCFCAPAPCYSTPVYRPAPVTYGCWGGGRVVYSYPVQGTIVYTPPIVTPPVIVPPPPVVVVKEKSLYERLGGEKAITAVVDDFVARAAKNDKVNFFRKGTDKEWKPTPAQVDQLKKHLVDLIGMATGGPQKYSGRDMKSSHAGMKITEAEFNALAADLKDTLDKFNVPAKEQGELFKIVGSTKDDIVEKK